MNMLSDILEEKIENLPAILSIQEIAEIFSVVPLTVYRQIYSQRLPAWKDEEGKWCIARADLQKFCSRNSSL